jgi:hypothetical protein
MLPQNGRVHLLNSFFLSARAQHPSQFTNIATGTVDFPIRDHESIANFDLRQISDFLRHNKNPSPQRH